MELWMDSSSLILYLFFFSGKQGIVLDLSMNINSEGI